MAFPSIRHRYGRVHANSGARDRSSMRYTESVRHVRASFCVAILFALALVGCGTVEPPDHAQPPVPPIDALPGTPRDAPLPDTAFSLESDPEFRRSSLAVEVVGWYDALLAGVVDPVGGFDPLSLAARDDVYQYGRTLHTYVQGVLLAFRVTGDLVLLDHVDEIAEVMRSRLRDGWRDTLDGTDGTRDGYLNWVFRYGNSTLYQGKDTHQVNEMRTHSMIATIAYALHVNRDSVSPGGRDYAAHADFWTDYLVNHFEAKWRERRGVADGFPIMVRPHTHTYYSWMKWHYYMGLLTGDAGYTGEAERMAGVLWGELRSVETASGVAYVWPRSVLGEGGGESYLHPTTYAGYVYADVVELHLEGFGGWADVVEMERFARTVSEFVFDSGDPFQSDFSSDIGGGVARAGLPSDGSWSRMSVARYGISGFAQIMAWDTSGALLEVSEAVYEERVRRGSGASRVLAGLILDAAIDSGSDRLSERSHPGRGRHLHTSSPPVDGIIDDRRVDVSFERGR